jgi:hypothetical protein
MVETTQHGVRAHGNILAQAMSGSGPQYPRVQLFLQDVRMTK